MPFFSFRLARSLLFLRFVPVGLGLVFSFYYSRMMGLELRSFLTLILVSNTLLTLFFQSGLGLNIRSSGSVDESKNLVFGHLIVSSLTSVLVSATLLCGLFLYNEYWLPWTDSEELPLSVYFAVALYSFFSALSFPLMELLGSFQTLRAFTLIEIMVIVVQILVFLFLILFNQTSLFVSVLISYTLSYAFCIFATLVLIISTRHYQTGIRASLQEVLSKRLLDNYIKSLTVAAIERLDKIYIYFFYSNPQLTQVSTFQSLLNVIRLIPDTQIRLLHHRKLVGNLDKRGKSVTSILQSGLILIFFGIFANIIILVGLGTEWALPLSMVFSLLVYEFAVWKVRSFILKPRTLDQQGVHRWRYLALFIFFILPLPLLMSVLSFEFVFLISSFLIFSWLIHTNRRATKDLSAC